MKKIIIATSISILMFIMSGCSKEKKILYVYNWADYISPEVISLFEKANDCKVVIDVFDDNEAMIAKLMAGGSGYDIAFPSSYAIGYMMNNNLIQKISLDSMPNVLNNFDKKYSNLLLSTNMEWSVPYALSITGIALRTDKFSATNSLSWNCVFENVFANRVSMLNDMREMLGIGLILNGFSVNSTNRNEILKSVETMKKFKSLTKRLDNTSYKVGLITSEFYVAFGYNSDIFQTMEEDKSQNIGFFVPSEGSTCCFDEMVVLNNANKELAFKFIDFMYQPEIAALNAKYIFTTIPNLNMIHLIDDELKSKIDVRKDVLDRLQLIKDVGDATQLYNDAWDKFISNK